MNDTIPLAAMTVCVALLAVFWVLYLIRIVQEDEKVKEYHREVRRRQEEARRVEEDREQEKGSKMSTMKNISKSVSPPNLSAAPPQEGA